MTYPTTADQINTAVSTPPAMASFTGKLSANARVETRPCDHGHARPCVVLELLTHSTAASMPIHCERPFAQGQEAQALAMARMLPVGTLVTVQAPVASLRLSLPNVTHLHTEPNPAQGMADLFAPAE